MSHISRPRISVSPAPLSPSVAFRCVVPLLWALAAWNSLACRGLFWDGAAFLVNIVDSGRFHDFYPARAHIAWATQWPVLLAVKLGVADTRLLAMIQSAALFVLPTALYQLALARARADAVLFAAVLAVVAVVYLPTSFFIIGEYNATYAAVTAAMAVVLTTGGSRRDAAILCALGVLCLRSYEAMAYLGPLLAAAVLWATRRRADDIVRLLGRVGALAFAGGALVSGITMAEYWYHPHFVAVRAAVPDFWQNLQFMIPLVGFAIVAVLGLVWPRWLRSGAPALAIGILAVLLVAVPWVRPFRPEAFLFPPSHYVARTAAGCVLWAMLAAMWIHAGWRRRPPAVLACLREPAVGRRLATAMAVLVVAAMVPDLVLTRMWTDYLGYFRGVVTGGTGVIQARDLPLQVWPQRLFAQPWTYPALSVILHDAPGQAIVQDRNYGEDQPFDPACGTVPRLTGFRWR